MIGIRTADGNKTVASVSIRTADGNKGVARAGILTATGAKDFFVSGGGGNLAVEASPISAIGTGLSGEAVAVTSNVVTLTATGGTPGYTYAWEETSEGSGITILSPASAGTRFRATLEPFDTVFGTFRGTVTDARGRTAFVDVEASLTNIGSLGGLS